MAVITKPHTLSDGSTILAAEHNSNYDTIYNEFNGNIDKANIKATAGIEDTKLAQITTASKVHGTSLTGLASMASAAGIIPNDNLGISMDTWTAAFTASSGTITIEPTYKTGAYVKIGKMVTITGHLTVASVSSPLGDLTITGLPFTSGNANKFGSGVAVAAGTLVSTATTSIVGYIVKNNTTIRLCKFAAGGIGALAGDVQANSWFYISATYFTD